MIEVRAVCLATPRACLFASCSTCFWLEARHSALRSDEVEEADARTRAFVIVATPDMIVAQSSRWAKRIVRIMFAEGACIQRGAVSVHVRIRKQTSPASLGYHDPTHTCRSTRRAYGVCQLHGSSSAYCRRTAVPPITTPQTAPALATAFCRHHHAYALPPPSQQQMFVNPARSHLPCCMRRALLHAHDSQTRTHPASLCSQTPSSIPTQLRPAAIRLGHITQPPRQPADLPPICQVRTPANKLRTAANILRTRRHLRRYSSPASTHTSRPLCMVRNLARLAAAAGPARVRRCLPATAPGMGQFSSRRSRERASGLRGEGQFGRGVGQGYARDGARRFLVRLPSSSSNSCQTTCQPVGVVGFVIKVVRTPPPHTAPPHPKQPHCPPQTHLALSASMIAPSDPYSAATAAALCGTTRCDSASHSTSAGTSDSASSSSSAAAAAAARSRRTSLMTRSGMVDLGVREMSLTRGRRQAGVRRRRPCRSSVSYVSHQPSAARRHAPTSPTPTPCQAPGTCPGSLSLMSQVVQVGCHLLLDTCAHAHSTLIPTPYGGS